MLEMRTRMTAQIEEEPVGAETGPEFGNRWRAAGQQIRQQGDECRQAGGDQVAPVSDPAAIAGIAHRMAGTGGLGRCPQALRRLHRQRRRLELVQRARQAGGKAAGRQ